MVKLCDSEFSLAQGELWLIAAVPPHFDVYQACEFYTEMKASAGTRPVFTKNPDQAMVFTRRNFVDAKWCLADTVNPQPIHAVQVKDCMEVCIKILEVMDGFPSIRVARYWKCKSLPPRENEFVDLEAAKVQLDKIKREYIRFYQDRLISIHRTAVI